MSWNKAHVRFRTPRPSRVLGVELLESRTVLSAVPAIIGLATPDPEPIVGAAVCVATPDPVAAGDVTCLPAQGAPTTADSGTVTTTPAPASATATAVVSQPQVTDGATSGSGAAQPLPESTAGGANAGTVSAQGAVVSNQAAVGSKLGSDAIAASPALASSSASLLSSPVALDGYGGGYGGPADLPPTTSGIPDVYVDENAADFVIQLYDSFDDLEDGPQGLTYGVVGDTNSSLFNSVGLDAYGGLVLDFAPNTFGDAVLTVRATDTASQYVETSFTVHVAEVNQAPVISDFYGTPEGGDLWTFQGTVTDVDDPVAGDVVSFGGVLAGFNVTATVRADGTFSFAQQFFGLQSGTATAQTQDPHGLYSNEAWYTVAVV